jgi:hypothetical protein
MSVHFIGGDTPEGFTEISHEFASAVASQEPADVELVLFNQVVEDNNRVKNSLEDR